MSLSFMLGVSVLDTDLPYVTRPPMAQFSLKAYPISGFMSRAHDFVLESEEVPYAPPIEPPMK